MKLTIASFICLLTYAIAEPNYCCPNNESLTEHGKCPNGNKHWASKLHCPIGAYLLFETDFTFHPEDDTLQVTDSSSVFTSDRFCLGHLNLNESEPEEKVALVCFKEDDNNNDYRTMNMTGARICTFISIFCLLVTLIVYIVLPDLRDLQGKCMMCIVFSYLLAFSFLAAVQQPQTNFAPTTCITIASLIYFWFMCVFFWLNVVAFNVWRSVVRPKWFVSKKYMFHVYSLYGWGGPLIFLISALIAQHVTGDHIKPGFGDNVCWFNAQSQKWVYFYGPISVLLLANIVMFVSTAFSLWKKGKNCSEDKLRSYKFKFLLYLKLSIVMGICWIFEPMSDLLYVEGVYIWAVTDYVNALQGLLILLLLVVFRKRVRRDFARKGICCNRLPKEWQTMPDEDCEELEESESLTTPEENATI